MKVKRAEVTNNTLETNGIAELELSGMPITALSGNLRQLGVQVALENKDETLGSVSDPVDLSIDWEGSLGLSECLHKKCRPPSEPSVSNLFSCHISHR